MSNSDMSNSDMSKFSFIDSVSSVFGINKLSFSKLGLIVVVSMFAVG
jgi:hypothetical protein